MRNRWWVAPPAVAAAALIAACGSSGTPSASHSTTNPAAAHASVTPQSDSTSSTSPTVTIMTQSTSKGTVLTNAQGKTIYWFAIDTPTTSNCTGTCLTYWPPVIGTPVAASGVSMSGHLGTITGANGQVQATYDGHPLYTYMGDTAAGQVTGNGLNLSGGLWWAMTPTGAMIGWSASGGGGSGGGGGTWG